MQLVVTWAEEHDELIARLRDPDELARESNVATRRMSEELRKGMAEIGLPVFYEMSEQRPGEKRFYPGTHIPRPWQAAAKILSNADMTRMGRPPPEYMIDETKRRVFSVEIGEPPTYDVLFPEYEPVVEYLDSEVDPSLRDAIRVIIKGPMPELSDLDYLDQLNEAFEIGFGDGTAPPDDKDDREEYEFVKRKLERKISELLPNPNTITKVAERYFTFSGIRPSTAIKYRRKIGCLIEEIGDVPVGHVSPSDLRKLRDKLLGRMLPASVQSVFTPIKGLFAFALDDQLIDVNPTYGVKLPKDRRPIEERKWLPFSPDEFSRIMMGVELEWGQSVRGLSEDRRVAIRMIVRALAFTAMRPNEALRLSPEDVNDRLIRIKGSKTEGSTRVIPVHPEISEFPDWVAAGGLDIFKHIVPAP